MANRPAVTGLFALAILAVLFVAAELLVPIAFAILLYLLFFPLVRALQRKGIPPSLSAGAVILSLVGLVITAGNLLAEPAQQWLQDAPKTIRSLQGEVFAARNQLSDIEQIAQEVDQLSIGDSDNGAQAVILKEPGLLEDLIVGLPSVIAFSGIVVFLTFFLLASGDSLLRQTTQLGRTFGERRRIVAICRQVQSDLSLYLTTVTAINFTLGGVVALAMYLLDVPNPMLWGAMAAVFNFAPYVGPLTATVVLAIVGLTTFDSLTQAALVPLTFLAIDIIEGQIVTPSILGRRLAMSPIFVFLAVIVWGWIWGVAGALMAVPIVTTVKVICDYVPQLKPIGRFLGSDRHDREKLRMAARRAQGGATVISIPPRSNDAHELILPDAERVRRR